MSISPVSILFDLSLKVIRRLPKLQEWLLVSLEKQPIFNRVIDLVNPTVTSIDAKISASRQTRWLDARSQGVVRDLVIVVPIFNGPVWVEQCLASLMSTVRERDLVLMIDDASQDPDLLQILEKFKADKRFILQRNDINMGYTKCVNKGFEAFPERDVILLNSDTVVGQRWIENLTYVAYSRTRIATVTPMSNNAGAFSSPVVGRENQLPTTEGIHSYCRKISRAGLGWELTVPTGNGFCMFVRRDSLNDIGHYDDAKYPRGYGEENDFCMRAWRSGWSNLVTDKVHIWHHGSKSFGSEKVSLLESGLRQLSLDYSEYQHLIKKFFGPDFALARAAHSRWDEKENELPRILYVMPIVGGGLPETNFDLVQGIRGKAKCYKFVARGKKMQLFGFDRDGAETLLESQDLLSLIDPASHNSEEFDRYICDILFRYSIDVMHVEHLSWQSLGMVDAAKSLSVRTIVSAHDYYLVCPSHNLLDENMAKCGGFCTKSQGVCGTTLWPTHKLPPMKHAFVSRWQERMSRLLDGADAVVAPSKAAASQIERIYPNLGNRLNVVEHGRDFSRFINPPKIVTSKRVLVPGNLNAAKGSRELVSILRKAEEYNLEFHVLGEAPTEIQKLGKYHGAYAREEFLEIVESIGPDIGLILSIWDETYCHTLTEMWAAGLPVLALDNGAVGERLRESSLGWLVAPDATADTILESLAGIFADEGELKSKYELVREWQLGRGRVSRIKMADAYMNVYNLS